MPDTNSFEPEFKKLSPPDQKATYENGQKIHNNGAGLPINEDHSRNLSPSATGKGGYVAAAVAKPASAAAPA